MRGSIKSWLRFFLRSRELRLRSFLIERSFLYEKESFKSGVGNDNGAV